MLGNVIRIIGVNIGIVALGMLLGSLGVNIVYSWFGNDTRIVGVNIGIVALEMTLGYLGVNIGIVGLVMMLG